MSQPPSLLKVAICAPVMGSDLGRIQALSPSIEILDGNAAFDAFRRAQGRGEQEASEEAQRALRALIAPADVVCMAYPVLPRVVEFVPNLRWFHHTQAGVSNLWSTDVWKADRVLLTSGRGYVRPTAIAEYAVAGAMLFARGLHDGYLDKQNQRLDRAHYRLRPIEMSTMGVVGLGGIGKEIARLSRALGMRVIATRRSVTARQEDVDFADVLLPPSKIGILASESDFLAVCTQLTEETFHLITRDVLSRMRSSAVIINVSRGETIDEDALLEALSEGRIQGAVLDVYEGEMDGKPPRPDLMAAPNVVITPHLSASGSAEGGAMMDLFCENLGRFLRDEPQLNVVDRARGY